MIYGKLPIVFLSTIASEKSGSTNSMIASYILDHLSEMNQIGIKELASRCHVAISSISRFCNEIGLSSYMELKELLSQSELSFDQQAYQIENQNLNQEYLKTITSSIMMVSKSIDMNKITQLCKDIKKYKKVAIFGLLKAETVAMNLQADLLMLSKQTYTKVSYISQMDYLKQATSDDLIIIFSYTGVYFDYEYRRLPSFLKAPKIYFITSGDIQQSEYINEVIHFDSKQDQLSHPYQLQYIAGLIAQVYASFNAIS